MRHLKFLTALLCPFIILLNCTLSFAEEITEIVLQEKTIYIEKGEKHKINYTILPQEESNRKVYFESDDEYVATVDPSGYVLGRHVGKAKIKLMLSDRKTAAYVTVCVEEDEDYYKLFDDDEEYYNQKPGLRKIYIMYNNEPGDRVELMVSQNAKLSIKPYPSGAESAVKWRTSDDSIADVDDNGTVTAKKEGKCIISAISKIGASKKDEIEVVVTRYIKTPDRIEIKVPQNAVFETGNTIKLTPVFYPEDTTEKRIRWLIYGSGAEINQNGELTITDKGTVKVRAVTYDWCVSCDLDIETKYSKNHFADIGKAFNVRNNRSIILNFDSPVDKVYAYNNIFASASDSGNDGYIDIEISVNDNTVTVTPKTEWEKGYNYIYIKDGMKDIYGNTLEKNYRYTMHVREG